MKKEISPKAILFYGPPGSGKGTQAKIMAEKLGFVHFDTGKFVEKMIHDPAFANDKKVQQQKKLFMTGKLADVKWVLDEILTKKIEELQPKGLVFSGSPRSEYEAFATKKKEGVAELLAKYYGIENIVAFSLDIPVAESVKRNSLRGREGLDVPAVIKIRCREYKERTAPILKGLKTYGIKVYKIDGKPTPKKVSALVNAAWKEYLKSARGVKDVKSVKSATPRKKS